MSEAQSSAAPSQTGPTESQAGGGGGGGGSRRDKLITIFKSASFAFLWGCGWGAIGGFLLIFTFLAMLTFYIRLIYWAIPADLPGREIKVEFIIDCCCACACACDILIVWAVWGLPTLVGGVFGMFYTTIALGCLSYFEFKKWKG
ncbi:unnamed protein product [Bursaphelenchus xylophilus]|uniref:(pine wood nematode) hypothetical protein n=1 Tax=Bursaphelenchus xylophilus TaxID=6326 RepID=A0A1I7SBW0_BURXY|nr:unnamed protein product [Bursaphelenchus xylophilus]CAG9112979.1 unnamed protein product [Bursaphelenchus xylophilus]